MKHIEKSFSWTSLGVLLSVSATLLGASTAWAHPDHAGASNAGLAHMLLDPFHAVWLVGAAGLGLAAWRIRARNRRKV
jgi:hypothetical protein